MADLVAFLEARLDEDEIIAADANGIRWDDPVGDPDDYWITNEHMHLFETDLGTARHIARWDPARVLAEIKAKRAHIALWREGNERMSAAIKKQRTATNDLSKKSAMLQREQALGFHEATVQLLQLDVAIYASHEDFDESWRT